MAIILSNMNNFVSSALIMAGIIIGLLCAWIVRLLRNRPPTEKEIRKLIDEK